VLPFWRALLGYRQIGDDYLFDPSGRGRCFDFQRMDVARPQRNRMHIDIAVPHDQAEARISGALAAGGRLVADAHAPDSCRRDRLAIFPGSWQVTVT
jgi:4a-hydroxytetrahydrobiopterin dehydratase